MVKKSLGLVWVAGLVFMLAAPALAQSYSARASVPFEFAVGQKVLPAGDYFVRVDVLGLIQVMDVAAADHINIVSHVTKSGQSQTEAVAKLVFNRYGNQTFLSEVWDGTSVDGYTLPMSRSERELTRTASVNKPEIVAVLARR